MKYVPKSLTRAVGTTVLKAQKNSPQLLFVAGMVGFGATVVMACKATMRVEDILTDHEKEMLNIQRAQGRTVGTDAVAEKERQKQLVHTAIKLGKLYGPSVVCGFVSVVCLTKSHKILNERNATLTAAYVGLQKFLDDYRGRVREKVGQEDEQNLYYSSTAVELVEDTPNGPMKVFGSAPGRPSPYAGIFNAYNQNWQDDNTFNLAYLRIQEERLTEKLRAQGNLMLNEVYDRLDMPRTPTGALVGWMIGHPDSDDFVEFKIIPMHDMDSSLMIDFNIGGQVYEMLSGRMSGRR